MSIEIPRPSAALPTAPAKLRILETANQLFYDDGIRTVGVDRLISASSVTKATFYKHYRSKDLLIIAYVEGRDRQVREWFAEQEAKNASPRDIARALAFYNAGQGGAAGPPATWPPETRAYVAAVLAHAGLGAAGARSTGLPLGPPVLRLIG